MEISANHKHQRINKDTNTHPGRVRATAVGVIEKSLKAIIDAASSQKCKPNQNFIREASVAVSNMDDNISEKDREATEEFMKFVSKPENYSLDNALIAFAIARREGTPNQIRALIKDFHTYCKTSLFKDKNLRPLIHKTSSIFILISSLQVPDDVVETLASLSITTYFHEASSQPVSNSAAQCIFKISAKLSKAAIAEIVRMGRQFPKANRKTVNTDEGRTSIGAISYLILGLVQSGLPKTISIKDLVGEMDSGFVLPAVVEDCATVLCHPLFPASLDIVSTSIPILLFRAVQKKSITNPLKNKSTRKRSKGEDSDDDFAFCEISKPVKERKEPKNPKDAVKKSKDGPLAASKALCAALKSVSSLRAEMKKNAIVCVPLSLAERLDKDNNKQLKKLREDGSDLFEFDVSTEVTHSDFEISIAKTVIAIYAQQVGAKNGCIQYIKRSFGIKTIPTDVSIEYPLSMISRLSLLLAGKERLFVGFAGICEALIGAATDEKTLPSVKASIMRGFSSVVAESPELLKQGSLVSAINKSVNDRSASVRDSIIEIVCSFVGSPNANTNDSIRFLPVLAIGLRDHSPLVARQSINAISALACSDNTTAEQKEKLLSLVLPLCSRSDAADAAVKAAVSIVESNDPILSVRSVGAFISNGGLIGEISERLNEDIVGKIIDAALEKPSEYAKVIKAFSGKASSRIDPVLSAINESTEFNADLADAAADILEKRDGNEASVSECRRCLSICRRAATRGSKEGVRSAIRLHAIIEEKIKCESGFLSKLLDSIIGRKMGQREAFTAGIIVRYGKLSEIDVKTAEDVLKAVNDISIKACTDICSAFPQFFQTMTSITDKINDESNSYSDIGDCLNFIEESLKIDGSLFGRCSKGIFRQCISENERNRMMGLKCVKRGIENAVVNQRAALPFIIASSISPCSSTNNVATEILKAIGEGDSQAVSLSLSEGLHLAFKAFKGLQKHSQLFESLNPKARILLIDSLQEVIEETVDSGDYQFAAFASEFALFLGVSTVGEAMRVFNATASPSVISSARAAKADIEQADIGCAKSAAVVLLFHEAVGKRFGVNRRDKRIDDASAVHLNGITKPSTKFFDSDNDALLEALSRGLKALKASKEK